MSTEQVPNFCSERESGWGNAPLARGTALSFNVYKLSAFLHRVQQFLFKAMNRRGCRRTYTWNGFIDMLKYDPLAKPKVYYPLY